MDLPAFRYHPDPIVTGSIKKSENTCVVCGQARGYVYAKRTSFRGKQYFDCICPWCIADGSAHQELGVWFNDDRGVGMGRVGAVPQSVVDEIVQRTPSFSGWQQEKWFTHCNDAAAFLGTVGHTELLEWGDAAITAIAASTGMHVGDSDWESFFKALDKEGAPRAYLFRCLHCGTFGGYTDTD